jgi:insulysin
MISLEALQSLTSPTGVALTEVFCSCLKEVLSEFSYYADCAGLQYDVKLAKGGVELMFFGYHHKLPVLVGKVLAEMKKMCGEEPCPSDCFSRVKEKVLRSYYNYRFWQPYYHCLLGFATCLEDPRWSSEEKYTALASSSLADFHSFSAQLVRSMKAEVFVHGNTTAEEAKALSASIVSALDFLPLSSSQEPLRRVVSLPKGKEYIYRQHSKTMNPKEPNSAVEMFLPVGDLEGYHADMDTRESSKIGTESLLELMAHIISEPAFDQLRTKEQLGYIVHTATKKVGHLCGLQVIVQSSHKDPTYLDARIEDFLVGFRVKLGAFTDEELQTNIQAVVEKLLEKPKNLDQESSRYWEEIKSASYLFDRKARLAKYLRSVTLKECLEYFDQYFAVGGADRRKCSSQFYGKGTKYPKPSSDPKVVIIKDSSHFKRTMSLEPIRSYLPELKR